jgi:hypothetical protein
VLLVRVDVALAATLRFGDAMSNITAMTFLKAVGLLSGCPFLFETKVSIIQGSNRT